VLRAFAAYQDADLLIAGDGEYRAELERAAAGNPRIRFLGRLPAEALEPYYRHAIAVLVPSICFETFGITVIEAFSHGTPVIARRLGPFPEILEQSGGGELFDSTDELIAHLRALQTAPQHRAALARAGYRAFRDRWSESAVTPRYISLVSEVLRRRTRGADSVAC
jgi:glycosyltransferase involved in cell wall biosynthesis